MRRNRDANIGAWLGVVTGVHVDVPPEEPLVWDGVKPGDVYYDVFVEGHNQAMFQRVQSGVNPTRGADVLPAPIGSPVIVTRYPASGSGSGVVYEQKAWILCWTIPFSGCESGVVDPPDGGIDPEIEPGEGEGNPDQPGPIGT